MVPRWLPDPKKDPLGITLGSLLEICLCVCFLCFVNTTCDVLVQDCGDFRSYFWINTFGALFVVF